MIPFEESNTKAFRLLTRIEVCIRELVRIEFEKAELDAGRAASSWQKRLPAPLLGRIRDSQRDEETRKQFDFVKLGPLYYLTFGELLEILSRKPGSNVVKTIGGDGVYSQLLALTQPRNSLAHSRSVSLTGLGLVEVVYQQLENALGHEALATLVANPSEGLRPDAALGSLRRWLCSIEEHFEQLRGPIDPWRDYSRCREQFWWGNADLAGFDTNEVDTLVTDLDQYNAVGSGIGAAGARRLVLQNTTLQKQLAALNGQIL